MKKHIQNQSKRFFTIILKYSFLLLVFAITISIIFLSKSYFNPNFNRGFLSGKELYFQGLYAVGLYIHVIIAPLLIFISSGLIFFRLEIRFPKIHRALGKIVLIAGLFLFVPSGFILASHAIGGTLGMILFGVLTTISGLSLIIAYVFIRKNQVVKHRKWMLRFYIFLISAIFLRINKFIFAYYFDYKGEEAYLTSVALSYIPQWFILESIFYLKDRMKSRQVNIS